MFLCVVFFFCLLLTCYGPASEIKKKKKKSKLSIFAELELEKIGIRELELPIGLANIG